MKQFKHYALLLVVALAMFGCGDDYDDTALKNDISDLKSRVEKLESWCSTANTQISALQGLVSALQENDYVTGVNPIMEGAKEVGYTITFAKAKPITILNGKDGENGTDGITPIISVKQDTDGQYYWTVTTGEADPVWMTDAEGKKINAAGQAGEAGHTPVISVETSDGKLCWKVDGKWLLDEKSNKVPATGEKGATGATGATGSTGSKGDQGDSIFKKGGINTDNDDYVIFTLTDGTEIKLMRALDVTIGIKDVKDEMIITPTEKDAGGKETELELPSVDDYKAITAEIKSKQGVDTDIATRAAAEGPELWKVELTKPVLDEDNKVTTPGKVKIIPYKDATEGDQAILTLSIIDKQNIEHTTVIIITYTDQIPVTGVKLGKTTLALEVGGKETLTATVLPANAKEKGVTWSSSDATIAKVDATGGEVVGVKAGTATITATTTDGGFTATCTVTVSNIVVTGVSFASTTATVSIGATTTLKPVFTPEKATIQTGTWKSSDETKATVSTAGVVTGVAEGAATITFTSTDGSKEATCTVTVSAAPTEYGWYINPTDKDNKIYTIGTADEFIEFAKLVNKDATLPTDLNRGDNFSGKTVKLSAHINLGNQTAWQPIGLNTQHYLEGTFDGGNFTITGTLTAPSTAKYFGIFGIVDGGEIKNLNFGGTMDISAISSENAISAGAIAGSVQNGIIINCSNTASLTTTSDQLMIGGIAGVANKVIACVNKGSIVGIKSAGGIVGLGTAIGCINKGSQIESSTAETTSSAGGIVGTSDGTVIACWSTATSVTGYQGMAGRNRNGGIVGYLMGGEAKNCYWKEISGVKGCGTTVGQGGFTDCASFTTDTPSADQITSMNAAWVAADSGRTFQFNASTGEIEAIQPG
mgnify:FL=1|jgi:uncharacterized protein YjdB